MTIQPTPLQNLYNNIRVNNQPLSSASIVTEPVSVDTTPAISNTIPNTTTPIEPSNTTVVTNTSSLPTLNPTPNISTIDLLTIQAAQQTITPIVQQSNAYSQTESLSLPTTTWDEASMNNTFDTEYANYQTPINNDNEMVQIIF